MRWLNISISSFVLSSFRSLTYLFLEHCSLSPPVLPGFPLLRTLILSFVGLSDEHHLSALASRCPSLEDLPLINILPFGRLHIHNPKLRNFHLHPVSYENITTFLGSQNLALVSHRGMDYEKTVINLAEFFGNSVLLLLNFQASAKPESILFHFQQLTVLTMEVDWEDMSSIHLFLSLSLTRSAPNLRHLCLEARIEASIDLFMHAFNIGMQQRTQNPDMDHNLIYNGFNSQDFWNRHGIGRLDKVRSMEMRHTVCTESEMSFIQFVLTRAPVLEKLASIG